MRVRVRVRARLRVTAFALALVVVMFLSCLLQACVWASQCVCAVLVPLGDDANDEDRGARVVKHEWLCYLGQFYGSDRILLLQ